MCFFFFAVDMAATVMITPSPVVEYLASMTNAGQNLASYYSRNPGAARREFEKLLRVRKTFILLLLMNRAPCVPISKMPLDAKLTSCPTS
jgi:hypothetical protein